MALLFEASKICSIPGQERKTVLRMNEAPAFVKSTVDTQEAFCKLLGEAIDEAFSSMGESPRKAIYMYLENSFGIAKQEIPYRINDFSDALEKVFGTGARTIEILCIRNIQAKARIDYKWNLPGSIGSELTLKEYMRTVSETLNSKKAINKRIQRETPLRKKG
jgi:hypothetical protein